MSLAPSPTVIDRRSSSPYASLPLAPHPAVAASRGEFATGLDLRHAGKRQLVLRYELLGDTALPALFVAGGISASRHVAASHAEAAIAAILDEAFNDEFLNDCGETAA